MNDKRKSDHYAKVMNQKYQPTKADMKADVSVPVSPERLAKAVTRGGASRREAPAKPKPK